MAKNNSDSLKKLINSFNPNFTANIQRELDRMTSSKSFTNLPYVTLQKTLRSNLSSENSNRKIFVPFISERDNVGRLLTADSNLMDTLGSFPPEICKTEGELLKYSRMRLVSPVAKNVSPVFAKYHSEVP